MTTCAAGSMRFEESSWTLYSSVNLRPVSGVTKVWNSLQRLPAQVAPVDQEADPVRPGVLQQPVRLAGGGVGLAGPGGHLDERPAPVTSQGLFEVHDGLELGGPQAGAVQRRHRPYAGAERGRSVPLAHLQPPGEGFGSVEPVHLAGPGYGVEEVGEPGLGAGRLVGERERPDRRGELVGEAGDVLAGLGLDADEGGADLLGLEHADRLAVHEEQVVGNAVAGLEGELADGDTCHRPARGGRGQVDRPVVLDDPAGRGQLLVDLNARSSLGRQVRLHAPVAGHGTPRLRRGWLHQDSVVTVGPMQPTSQERSRQTPVRRGVGPRSWRCARHRPLRQHRKQPRHPSCTPTPTPDGTARGRLVRLLAATRSASPIACGVTAETLAVSGDQGCGGAGQGTGIQCPC